MVSLRLASRQIFRKSPGKGVMVGANSFYTRARGIEKMGTMSRVTRSDSADEIYRFFSDDNGRTWSESEQISFITNTDRGTHRAYPEPGFVDPDRDRLLTMVIAGTLPSDDPLEGMEHWTLYYRVSRDGGRTSAVEERVIQDGGFDSSHPCEGVWVGKNSMMIGDQTCRPIRTSEGRILMPIQVTPLGPDGRYHNPGGGYTYHQSAVLIGRWLDGDRIGWDLSEYVSNDPDLSTRGALEPTLAELPDGRILMVMRGSNDVKPQLPGRRWFSLSEDDGKTWSPIEVWRYDDGSNLYSPSSCSQLLRHSNGSYYWLGNISRVNAKGNWPRYPLVVGEVDTESALLKRDTVTMIDDRGPLDHEMMCLSNFMAHEDRETHEIVLHMTRLFPREHLDWTADALIYRMDTQHQGGDSLGRRDG